MLISGWVGKRTENIAVNADGHLFISDGYVCSDIDKGATSYYGFVNNKGSWYIMKKTDVAIRFVKGSSDYVDNFNNRASLEYDYYYNVFGEA